MILTVTQLNKYIAMKIDSDQKLRGIFLRGEVSNFIAHRSGHCYFTLKDGSSAVKAVMFRNFAASLKFKPENGMSVVAMGSITVYERDGVYQINVTDLVPDGAGAESVAAEQLKERLRKAGVFDESHKRPLPELPGKIGVVTSPTGAALQDIINILSRRFPIGELKVFPAVVQGEDAPGSICRGIASAEKDGCDVIIVGRGGGSAEDLSAFNTEAVAMSIYNCAVPVISAVGHQTDLTIADLAADKRAPTPSAAAELASVSAEKLLGDIDFLAKRLRNLAAQRIASCENSLVRIEGRLGRRSPQYRLEHSEKMLVSLEGRLGNAYGAKISACERRFLTLISKMEAMSPLKVMKRGYSLAYDADGRLLTSAKELKPGDNVDIMLCDGGFSARVTEVKEG